MGSRILVADDSITIQKVVNLTFADEGIEVVAVSNGDLAERRLNEVNPDLVLADIFMPGKNGYELCESIKANPQFRNVPVVLLVGAFEPFDQAEARRVRADAHLTKPFESRTLVETVRRLISARALATTGPIASQPSPGEGREALHQADPAPTWVITPTTPKLDASEMMADANVPPATPVGTTGELASSPAEAPQVFNVGVTDMPAHEALDAAFNGASEHFDPLELAATGELPHGEMHSAPEPDQPDVILDFDKTGTFESSAPLGTDPLETEVSASTGSGEGAEWFCKDHLDNRAVESVSTNNARRANAITAPLNGQGATFRMQGETAYAPSEGSTDAACATMLAADDPLGDVLLDATVSSGMLPFEHDLLDIELSESTVVEASAVADTQFDLVETAEDSSDSPQAFAVVDHSIEDDLHKTGGALSMTDQPHADAAGLPDDSQADSVDSDDILDWTQHAGSFSPAQPDSEIIPIDIPVSQPDSVLMAIDNSGSQLDSGTLPIDAEEALAENPAETAAQEVDNTQEASFESARTWPEEEARFTAIDIEAFPVEESKAPAQSEATETGFSLSAVTPEQPDLSISAPVTDATPSEQSTNGAPSSSELSSATIEEIVRRVVAKMSESVVREVAWEVVPDCVERVIDQLTRESLSKRA